MSSFSINNGVIYKDGEPFFMHLMYFENEDISGNYPRLRAYLNNRADNTKLTQMGINTVFTPLSIATSNKANSISLLNDLASQGIYLLNESAGTGDAEYTNYVNYEAYAGCLASYTRSENVLLTTGATQTKTVNAHCDDIADPRGRPNATSGYKNASPVSTAFGPGVGTALPAINYNGSTYTHQMSGGHKNFPNSNWAKARHKVAWQALGANKLVLGTGYRWRDQASAAPIETSWTEIGSKFADNNKIFGLKKYCQFSAPASYPGVFDITGFQVYGMRLNNTDPNGFGRPYAGMYALTDGGAQTIVRTVYMAIIGTYQSDWDLPTAPDLRNQTYQAIIAGAKSIAYYSMSTYYAPANCLYGCPPDRRLEIGLFWNEMNLKSLALDGITRVGETYMKHVLLGKHHIHYATGTGMLNLDEVEGGYSAMPIVVCASWVLGNSRFILVANRDRRSSSTVTNISINLAENLNGVPVSEWETRDNYNLFYCGLNDKKPSTTTWSLNADKKTLQISSLPPNQVLLLQTTLPGEDGGGDVITPPSTGFTNRSVVYVTSGNRASANTNAVTDIGNAADNLTWDKKAYTADNRGRPNSWAASTVYTLDDQVKTTANRWYVCETAGTSSGTEPTHTSGTATDGSVTWRYIGTVTTQDFYLCDGIFTDAQIDAVMARSYTPSIRHFRFNQEENGPLIGSTARYGAGLTGQSALTLSTMNSIIGDERFAPSDYGTPIVWWDFGAQDLVLNPSGVRATNGEGIATVNPLAGSAVLVQATDTNRPTLQINQLNGKSVIGYIGSDNNRMLTTTTRSLVKNVASVTLVCVFKCTPEGINASPAVNQRLFTHNNNGGLSRCVMMVDTNDKILLGGRSSDSGAEIFTSFSSTPAIVADTWYIVFGTMNYSTQAGEIFINNVSSGTGNICGTAGTVANTDASSDPIVGRDISAAYDFIGSMACFGIYNGILTQEQRTGLYHRLKRFYNL